MKKTAFPLKSLMVIGLMVWSMSAHAQGYDVAHGQVFYGHEPLKHADARSFEDLGFGYAKDRNNVYLKGHVLEYVDPATFRLKRRTNSPSHEPRGKNEHGKAHNKYHKTQFNVYYGDKKLDATAATFKEIGGGYAKDAFNVFYYGKKVEGASAATFKYTGDGYEKDAFTDYYRGRKLE